MSNNTLNPMESKKTKIYGASDDLIEIEGAVYDEVGCYSDAPKWIGIEASDGTRAKIRYDGNWSIKVTDTGSLFEKIVTGNPEEDDHTDIDAKCAPGYSDVLVFEKGIEWIKIGKKKFKKSH